MERTKNKSKSFFKGKVKIDLKKDYDRKELQRKSIKDSKITRNRSEDYKFPENVNMNKYFWLPKGGITTNGLSKSAMAVYPVLCAQANFEKDLWFQISQKTIGIRTGITIKTVCTALKELERTQITDPSGISHQLIEKKKIPGERSYYVYKVFFYRTNTFKKDAITFHTCIIDTSIWQILKNRTKVVYLAMRSIATYDPELHAFETDLDINPHSAEFRDRVFDMIYPHQLGEICSIATTSRTGFHLILEELEEWGLIKYEEDDSIMVYLKPNII